MDTTHASSGGAVEFYLPGTFQFARSPGRIERFLARHLGSRESDPSATRSSDGPGFYLPATPALRPR